MVKAHIELENIYLQHSNMNYHQQINYFLDFYEVQDGIKNSFHIPELRTTLI